MNTTRWLFGTVNLLLPEFPSLDILEQMCYPHHHTEDSIQARTNALKSKCSRRMIKSKENRRYKFKFTEILHSLNNQKINPVPKK